jgi:predicted kinase
MKINDKISVLSTKKRGLRSKLKLNNDVRSFKIPTFTMLVGLPGSGKSNFAEQLKNRNIIHSSDKLRKELYGDENVQKYNSELFVELHRRIKEDLKKGKNVIYDATNLKKKRRIALLEELKKIPCKKVCVCIMTPYEDCLKYNSKRERKAPEDVIKNMYMSWNPPAKEEGFDKIYYKYNFIDDYRTVLERYTISTLFNGECGIDNFNQENSHHALSLGQHCEKAYRYVIDKFSTEENWHSLLCLATLLHEIGKVFTKTKFNSKGIEDGDAHYFQHHCVGAYDSLFYTYGFGNYLAFVFATWLCCWGISHHRHGHHMRGLIGILLLFCILIGYNAVYLSYYFSPSTFIMSPFTYLLVLYIIYSIVDYIRQWNIIKQKRQSSYDSLIETESEF